MESETPRKTKQTKFSWLRVLGLVVAVIGTLLAIATFGISTSHKKSPQYTCDMNIEAIEQAKQIWALENQKGTNDTPSEADLIPHLKNGVFPTCPSGGTYKINPNNVRANCSVHAMVAPPITRSIPAD